MRIVRTTRKVRPVEPAGRYKAAAAANVDRVQAALARYQSTLAGMVERGEPRKRQEEQQS